MKLMGVAINLINEQSVNEASSLGRIPLNIACAEGSNDFVALLLSKGADFAMTNKNGWTPLNSASINGHAEVVKMLLEKGADFTTASNDGWTPLNSASINGHTEVVKMLLLLLLLLFNAGGNRNSQPPEGHRACGRLSSYTSYQYIHGKRPSGGLVRQ
jgi:ankyrin repeat protein